MRLPKIVVKLEGLIFGTCEFWKECPYHSSSDTCLKHGGMYYSQDVLGRPAGCYNRMLELEGARSTGVIST